MKQEQSYLKITLLQVKEWDGFQAAMRKTMQGADRRVSR